MENLEPKVQLNEVGLGSPGHRLLNGHRTQVAATSKAGLKRLSSSLCVALPDPFLTCLQPRNAAGPGSVILPGEEPAPSQRVALVSFRPGFQNKL